MNFLKITSEKLSVDTVYKLFASASCGRVNLFVDITRNNVNDEKTNFLEDEAYKSMALQVLEGMCSQIRNKWKTVKNIAIYQRLGIIHEEEPSAIIGISSLHQIEAIHATDWCVQNLKKSLPDRKKELCDSNSPHQVGSKEANCPDNEEPYICQEVISPHMPPHFIHIKASPAEAKKRIKACMENRRNEINRKNILEFCGRDMNSEFSCARIDAILNKRKDSKGHLQVDRVLNTFQQRDQLNSNYLTKHMPLNGIEERLQNLETHLCFSTSVPNNFYQRLKLLEDRMLRLESISPEYIQFWDKVGDKSKQSSKKKIFSLAEIDSLINDLERTKRRKL